MFKKMEGETNTEVVKKRKKQAKSSSESKEANII